MLELNQLSKQYANYPALQDLSFSAERGEIIGLLGPNGSGKSTSLKILAGIITPTSGEIKWEGQSFQNTDLKFRRNIAYVPEVAATYPELQVHEYLTLMLRLAGFDRHTTEQKLAEGLEKFQLSTVSKKICGNLSKGYQQRLMLAQAMLRDPKLLLLDEPNTGLDPVQIKELIDLLTVEAPKMIIILSSHQLREVELLCTRVVGLSRGKKIFDQNLRTEAGEIDLEELYQRTV